MHRDEDAKPVVGGAAHRGVEPLPAVRGLGRVARVAQAGPRARCDLRPASGQPDDAGAERVRPLVPERRSPRPRTARSPCNPSVSPRASADAAQASAARSARIVLQRLSELHPRRAAAATRRAVPRAVSERTEQEQREREAHAAAAAGQRAGDGCLRRRRSAVAAPTRAVPRCRASPGRASRHERRRRAPAAATAAAARPSGPSGCSASCGPRTEDLARRRRRCPLRRQRERALAAAGGGGPITAGAGHDLEVLLHAGVARRRDDLRILSKRRHRARTGKDEACEHGDDALHEELIRRTHRPADASCQRQRRRSVHADMAQAVAQRLALPAHGLGEACSVGRRVAARLRSPRACSRSRAAATTRSSAARRGLPSGGSWRSAAWSARSRRPCLRARRWWPPACSPRSASGAGSDYRRPRARSARSARWPASRRTSASCCSD